MRIFGSLRAAAADDEQPEKRDAGCVENGPLDMEPAGEEDNRSASWSPTTHQLLIMTTLSVISFMVALDACIIVTSLNAIVIDLNGTATQAFWVGTSYLLSNAVSMPFLAALSHTFGRPLLLIFSILMFTLGTTICCTSHDMTTLLGGRAVQGIGGGGVIVLSLVIFTDIVPLRYRPKWYGTVQGAWALGNCLGPICGGIIAQKTTWRWVFYVMYPFCGFGFVAVPLLLTLKPKTETMGKKLARVDWLGGFLFISSSTSVLIAISWGGSQFAWDSVQTIAPLVVGLVGLAASWAWEQYGAKEPFLKHSLFSTASAVATYVCGAAQGLIIFGQLYYVPLYFMSILAKDPIHTGMALLPVAFTLIPGSIITGILVTRLNNFRWPIWLGWVLLTLGCGLTLLFDQHTSTVLWAATLVILGFGHGSILNAQNFASQAICSQGDEGPAAAMYAFMRQFGTALGVGIGGSAFQNVMSLKLSWESLPTDIASNAEAFIPFLLAMPDGPQKRPYVDAYVYGFHGVFLVYLCLSAAALVLSLIIRHHDMNREIKTDQTLHENRVSRLIDDKFGARVSVVTPDSGCTISKDEMRSDV